MKLLSFIPVDGFSYEYSEQVTLGGVAFRSLNQGYIADNGIVVPKVEQLYIFGGQVETDHQLVTKQGGVARANNILAKTRRASLFYDKAVIDGDSALNPKSFDGLNKRLQGRQVIEAGEDGAALTLAMVGDLIDRTIGPNEKKVLVMCKADRRKLKQLLVASAGGAAVSDVGGSLASYDGVRVQVIDEDGDDQPILAKDETQGVNVDTSSIYCVVLGSDVDGENMQGLISGRMIDQYESGMAGPMHIDIVECHARLGTFHGRCAARLKGVR